MKQANEEIRNKLPKRLRRNAAEKPAKKERAKELKPGMYAPPAIIGFLIGLLVRLLFERLK